MRRLLIAVAMAAVMASLLPAPAWLDGASPIVKEYASPEGAFLYSTGGAGTAGQPYFSEMRGCESQEAVLYLQTAYEGYPLRRIVSLGRCGSAEVVVPDTVEEVDPGAFADCQSLERLRFMGGRPAGFSEPPGTEVLHAEGAPGWGGEGFPVMTYGGAGFSFRFFEAGGIAFVCGPGSGDAVTVPATIDSEGRDLPVRIGHSAFMGTGIRAVTLEEGVSHIGARAFYLCSSLESAELPSTLRTISDEAFRECGRLGDTDIGGAEFMGFECFRMCYSMTSIVIPDTVRDLKEGALRVCTSLTRATVGSGVTDLEDWLFSHCRSLETVEMKGEVRRVGDSAFYACEALTEISLPHAESLGRDAFRGCRFLDRAETGEGLRSIGASAFEDCVRLSSVRFPASLESIGDHAFQGCRSLMALYASAGPPGTVGEGAFLGIPSDAAIVCPPGTEGRWREAVWGPEAGGADPLWVAIPCIAAAAVLAWLLLRGRA